MDYVFLHVFRIDNGRPFELRTHTEAGFVLSPPSKSIEYSSFEPKTAFTYILIFYIYTVPSWEVTYPFPASTFEFLDFPIFTFGRIWIRFPFGYMICKCSRFHFGSLCSCQYETCSSQLEGWLQHVSLRMKCRPLQPNLWFFHVSYNSSNANLSIQVSIYRKIACDCQLASPTL